MSQINRELGRIVADRRNRAGISQEELANRADIHRTYVSQIERGLKSPTLSVLLKIAMSVDTNVSEILKELEAYLNEIPGKRKL